MWWQAVILYKINQPKQRKALKAVEITSSGGKYSEIEKILFSRSYVRFHPPSATRILKKVSLHIRFVHGTLLSIVPSSFIVEVKVSSRALFIKNLFVIFFCVVPSFFIKFICDCASRRDFPDICELYMRWHPVNRYSSVKFVSKVLNLLYQVLSSDLWSCCWVLRMFAVCKNMYR